MPAVGGVNVRVRGRRNRAVVVGLAALLLAQAAPARAGADPIKIGQTYPYSGPASGLATEAKTDVAYVKMINAAGGIDGRPIELVSLDDGFSPPKTVELTRRLIEEDKVSLLSAVLEANPDWNGVFYAPRKRIFPDELTYSQRRMILCEDQ